RPGLVDGALEAEDVLVLEHLLQVAGDRGAHVVRGRYVAVGVARADLRADLREQVAGAGDRIGAGLPAVEHVIGVLVGAAAAEVVGQLVGQRGVVAAGVTEHLGRAVALHVPAEADARRDHVGEVGLGEGRARGQLVVELVGAQPEVQQQVRGDVPDVLDVERLGLGRDRGAGDVVARIDVRGHAIGHGHAVGQGAVGFVRGDALHGVAHAITRVHARAVGVHDLLVPAEAQQVVAQRPLEVEAGGLALVVAAADAAIARVATFRLGGGAEQAGELAVAGNDAAALVPRAAGQGTALVHAV